MRPFTMHIDIALPRDRVIEQFDDAQNLFKWQEGLQSFEHIDGEPGQPGARSRLVYKMGNRPFELTETITVKELPDRFDGRYDWEGGSNTLQNRFIELGPSLTRWETTCEFQLRSLPMRIMAALMPGMFRKQHLRFLRNFKAMCEEGRDVREKA